MKTSRRPIGELLEAVKGQQKVKRSSYQKFGSFPIVDQSQELISGYIDDSAFLYNGNLPIIVFGDHTRILKYVDFPFCVGADGTQLLQPTKDIDIRYFYYALRNINLESYGYERHFKYLKKAEISLPDQKQQARISDILSAYDTLIANSQRRIMILESMARALYREWFVNLHFPGHETIPSIESSKGQIPQGWEVRTFDSLLASMTGGDWGGEQPAARETEAVIVVRGTDFDEVAYGGQLRAPVRYIKPSSLTSRGLKVGDVIIENSINAKSRCVGTTLLVDNSVLNRLGQDAIAASFCKVLRPHQKELAPLIHLHARHLREDGRMEYYQNVATNGIGNFQAQKFSKEEYLILPADEGERARLLAPFSVIFGNIGLLASRLANLRRTRDLLLPSLISGQIDV